MLTYYCKIVPKLAKFGFRETCSIYFKANTYFCCYMFTIKSLILSLYYAYFVTITQIVNLLTMIMLVKSGTTRDRTAYREDYNTGKKTRYILEFIWKKWLQFFGFFNVPYPGNHQ